MIPCRPPQKGWMPQPGCSSEALPCPRPAQMSSLRTSSSPGLGPPTLVVRLRHLSSFPDPAKVQITSCGEGDEHGAPQLSGQVPVQALRVRLLGISLKAFNWYLCKTFLGGFKILGGVRLWERPQQVDRDACPARCFAPHAGREPAEAVLVAQRVFRTF